MLGLWGDLFIFVFFYIGCLVVLNLFNCNKYLAVLIHQHATKKSLLLLKNIQTIKRVKEEDGIFFGDQTSQNHMCNIMLSPLTVVMVDVSLLLC